MTPHELQACTSFLLGHLHEGIRAIIESEVDLNSKMKALDDLEFELRKDIKKLYYPSPIEPSPI